MKPLGTARKSRVPGYLKFAKNVTPLKAATYA